MNKGKPTIVNGKIKRFRCIEEYVLVDELGNIIENDGKQQQHKKKPSQTPLNHQAHRDFYTKKVASLFHSNSHNTSILTTTTAKPLLGNVRDDFPRPTATIAPNASVQQSVLSAEYMSTMGQNPIAQGLSIRRLPANNTRRFDQRRSIEKARQTKSSTPASNEVVEYPEYPEYENNEGQEKQSKFHRMPYRIKGAYFAEDFDDDYFTGPDAGRHTYYSRTARRFPSMLHRRRPLLPRPGEPLYEDEARDHLGRPEQPYTSDRLENYSLKSTLPKMFTNPKREHGTMQRYWQNIRESTNNAPLTSSQRRASIRSSSSRTAEKTAASDEEDSSVERIPEVQRNRKPAWPAVINTKNGSECFSGQNKISCVTTAQHPQPPQRTPGQVIGPPSVPQPQMSPQVTSLHQTPENCQKVISYAKMFGVSNPQSWKARIAGHYFLLFPSCAHSFPSLERQQRMRAAGKQQEIVAGDSRLLENFDKASMKPSFAFIEFPHHALGLDITQILVLENE
ncbi:hypothetical protein DdX_03079 [Ditylenchus destructor]|uniref:Uncharacterized protein n=1 Tax=Ditylenchus destructor TaxID=166010 RepID=A0AAD4R6K6_9BILA|nr:hypothetical protein DdX_03079 [Ditylenchus destructor]